MPPVRGDNLKSYFKTLTRLSKIYSIAVMKYIKTYIRELKRPSWLNSHRLLGLVFHTVPLFGGRILHLWWKLIIKYWIHGWKLTSTLCRMSRQWRLYCAANGLWMYTHTTWITRLEKMWVIIVLKEVFFDCSLDILYYILIIRETSNCNINCRSMGNQFMI